MTAPGETPRPQMVLLDRDGVLNADRPDSVKTPEELVLIPGAAEAVARLNRAGVKAVVVTNQSVAGRGIVDDAMLARIHEKLRTELARKGAALDAIIVCTDHPDRATERRKPGTGMLREALAQFGIAPSRALVIGDALRDLEAAAALGCPRVLVRSGKGAATERAGIPAHLQPVAVHDDLAAAAGALLGGASEAAEPAVPRLGSRWAPFLAAALFAAAVAWAAGFAWFVCALPDHVEDPARHTDAIVVLTGGTERISTGLDLLAQGLGRRLLVSGVHRDVDVAELLRLTPEAPAALSCCIDLGYEAGDTIGNAAEAAEWMRAQGFHSLRLVTASYHLPRSLLEFHRAMPDVEVIAHPVFPASVQPDALWRKPASLWLMAQEYSKYLLARLHRALIDRAAAWWAGP